MSGNSREMRERGKRIGQIRINKSSRLDIHHGWSRFVGSPLSSPISLTLLSGHFDRLCQGQHNPLTQNLACILIVSKHDPAVERWNSMVRLSCASSFCLFIHVFPSYQRENVWRYFKFTRQTTKVSLIGMIVFPGTIYAISTLSIVSLSFCD